VYRQLVVIKFYKRTFVVVDMKVNEINDVTNFLFENKLHAHIDTKDGGYFNGLIFEVNENFVVIHDRVLGVTPISFSEIKSVEKFRSKEE